MIAISEALDNQLVTLVGLLIGLVGSVNGYFLYKLNNKTTKVERDTTQINNAVNHVEPGKKSLTQRVDRIEETLHTVQYDMDVAKKTAIEVSELTAENAKETSAVKIMVESLMKSHVDTKSKLDEILNVIPKRKTDEG